MEPLTIKTPADVLSFIGHTLGLWPHESLVCITLDANRIGATLRVDLPNRDGGLGYARTVADYLAHDASAASVLFAVYTSEAQKTRTAQTARSNHRSTDLCAGRTRNDHPGRAPRRRHDRLPVRRRSPGRTDTSAEGDPVQPDQRRIRVPRQHHRTDQPRHPAGLDKRRPHRERR
ncbi:DUF4192 family protein [Arthrobacter sp. ZGTC131]|uniref:DUF4192 family protein n=1 Tax=Arthrobacter sp. ZGTC131 TaxID=2058898 RepID=UPI000CE3FD3D|nr:DUF4192 family protein [Arthrobacter sp. ZGTC131]